MDLTPSTSCQMPLKGDVWSQIPPTGDNWMDKCQIRERNRNYRKDQINGNNRRHTVTEMPSSGSTRHRDIHRPHYERQPAGWSHVSTFIPANYWRRTGIDKIQNNERSQPFTDIPSSHQVQYQEKLEVTQIREPIGMPQHPRDHETNDTVPKPTIQRKRPVVRRRHTVDLVPKQREIPLGYEYYSSNRYQTAKNLPNERTRAARSVVQCDKTNHVTQISFDDMLGIIKPCVQISRSRFSKSGRKFGHD